MSSTASKPMRADARRNRERVLEAARECFARDGIEAQMDDVAALAGVGVGTVYRHFATKEQLFRALASDYFDGQAQIARAAQQIDDPWTAFSEFIRNGAELMANSRAIAQIAAVYPEIMEDAAVGADAVVGFLGTVEALIRRAQDAGVLRADFELEDVPAIMCSIGSLQVCRGSFANWRRLLGIVLDGLGPEAEVELPAVVERLRRAPKS